MIMPSTMIAFLRSASLFFSSALLSGLGSLALGAPVAAAPSGSGQPIPSWSDRVKEVPLGPGRLSIDFSVRTRFEYFNDFNIKGYAGDKNTALLLLRTQLGADYRVGDARLYVQLQDARFRSDSLERDDFPGSCPYFDAVDVRQAYGEWNRIGATPFGFKIGRQSISYRDKRIFGPGDWGNIGRYWWDAAILRVEAERLGLDLLYGRQVRSEPTQFNRRHFDFEMAGAYARLRGLPIDLDLFYVLRYDDSGKVIGESGPGDQRTHTVGLYSRAEAGGFDFGGTLAGQFGRFGGDEIRAFGGHVGVGYTVAHPWEPRVALDFSYASGDGDPGDGVQETFDGVFGSIDSFYGHMNLVSWKNLEDYQLSLSLQPSERWRLQLEGHLLGLAAAEDAWYWSSGSPIRRDPTGRSGRMLGFEIDSLLTWQITSSVELYTGYAHFFAGEFPRSTPGGSPDADWFFFQFLFHF
jgi:hypothetical protein